MTATRNLRQELRPVRMPIVRLILVSLVLFAAGGCQLVDEGETRREREQARQAQLASEEPKETFERANELMSAGEYSRALSSYDHVVKARPGSLVARVNRLTALANVSWRSSEFESEAEKLIGELHGVGSSVRQVYRVHVLMLMGLWLEQRAIANGSWDEQQTHLRQSVERLGEANDLAETLGASIVELVEDDYNRVSLWLMLREQSRDRRLSKPVGADDGSRLIFGSDNSLD